MHDEILISLLRIYHEHNQQYRLLSDLLVRIETFHRDTLDEILNALEVPEESDTFDRDWYFFTFDEMVKEGTRTECLAFLRAVENQR